jgi:HEPN domain-containing protein
MNKSREHARLLMEKAAEDVYVLQRLVADAESPMAAIGFHAQQAAEKCLKAVLTSRAIPYARTHDIAGLLKLLRKNGISEPPVEGQLPMLTPYAADFRYDRLPDEEEGKPVLDRAWVVRSVEQVYVWAQAVLGPDAAGK